MGARSFETLIVHDHDHPTGGLLPEDLLARGDLPASMHPRLLEGAAAGGIEDVESRALLVLTLDGRPALLAPYSLATVYLDCLAPAWVQAMAARVRALFPGFLRIRVLFFGPPTSLGCLDVLDLGNGDPETARVAVILRSLQLLEDRRATALVWKETDPETDPWWRRFLAGRLARYPSVPTMKQELAATSMEEYEASLRSGYRRQLRQGRARAHRAGLEVALGQDLAAHLEDWHPLFRNVVERSETRLETLAPGFFAALARDPSFVLNTVHREGRLVGGALCRAYGDTLVFLYVGMDYAAAGDSDLYFVLLESVLRLAFREGCRRISWGQTSLDAKARFGAECVPLWFYVRFRHSWADGLVRRLAPLLFPEREALSRRVFRSTPE